MKLLISALIILGAASSLKEGAVLSFYSKSYSFPDTTEGALLSYGFEFINEGDSPLLVTDYKVACSCTKAIFSGKPILPGQKGKITVMFDTNQKYGFQNRVVEVYSNGSKKPQKLRIKVNVIPKGYE